MKKVEAYKKVIVPILLRYSVTKAALFGSTVKNMTNRDSDVDLLIEPSKDFTLFKMLQLEDELSQAIQRKVDLVEFTAIKSSIRNEVLSSAIDIL